MRAAGTALVVRRAHGAAHTAVLARDLFTRVLARWAAPLALCNNIDMFNFMSLLPPERSRPVLKKVDMVVKRTFF